MSAGDTYQVTERRADEIKPGMQALYYGYDGWFTVERVKPSVGSGNYVGVLSANARVWFTAEQDAPILTRSKPAWSWGCDGKVFISTEPNGLCSYLIKVEDGGDATDWPLTTRDLESLRDALIEHLGLPS